MTLIVFIACVCGSAEAALLINNFDPDKHNRFENDPAFIAAGHDWSGIGRNDVDAGLWGTLITPSFMLTATHATVTGQVTFFSSNDPNGATETRNVISSTPITLDGQVLVSDLTLVQLDAPSTQNVYPILEAPLVGDELLVFGLSNTLANGKEANVRVGRNEITEILPAFSDMGLGPRVGDVFIYDYDTTAGGLGDDEARLVGGDSGGPSFTLVNGQPALVGIHWFRFDPGDFASTPFEGSGDTLVGSFIDEINSAIALTGSSETVSLIAAVPEPQSLLLVCASATILAFRRKRS